MKLDRPIMAPALDSGFENLRVERGDVQRAYFRRKDTRCWKRYGRMRKQYMRHMGCGRGLQWITKGRVSHEFVY